MTLSLRADRLMPRTPGRWLRILAWASMLANAVLILTGGLVRLTGSGLGCPTWPRCTDASWTNTPEMGMHGVIEFGNRLLTFALAGIAILTFLAVWRLRRRHRGLFWIALVMGLGIPLQAVLGGVTVLTGLNPWVVGVHFLVSSGLIALGGVLVNRTRRVSLPAVAAAERPGQVVGAGTRVIRGLALVIAVSAFLTIYIGTLVTGTGPHSGDSGDVARHTFDAYWVTRAHAVPVYLIVITTLAALVAGVRSRWPVPVMRLLWLLAGLLVTQAAIGYYQFFNGLPIVAVAAHLVGAAALSAVVSMSVEKMFAVSVGPTQEPSGESAGEQRPQRQHQ